MMRERIARCAVAGSMLLMISCTGEDAMNTRSGAMNTLEDQSATMRQVLDEVAQGLGAGTPDYEIVESPCNGPGLTDKNRVDVYYRGALSGSESFVEVVHGVLDDRGWDYEDSASDSTHYVYARRNGMTLEIGRLSSGPEVSLVGRSTCM